MAGDLMIETQYDTKIEAVFSNDYVPRLRDLGVLVSDISHDESRNVLTLVLDLPPTADIDLRRAVGRVLAEFEEGVLLAVITDASYRHVDEVTSEAPAPA